MINIVALPDAAQAKLTELQALCGAAEDALRGIAHRIANLPRDADAMRERLETARDEQSRRHNALHQLLNRLQQWLRELPSSIAVETAAATQPVELDGKTLADVLAATRSEIGALKAQMVSVKNAPLPMADVKQLAESFVVRLMQQRPTVTVGRDQIRLASPEVDMLAPSAVMQSVLATVAWIAPDAVLRAIEREIDALGERTDALSAAERIKRVGEIEAQLLELERREEALIMRAADDGLEVLRRVDADPRAFWAS
jgi:hypothetical protein